MVNYQSLIGRQWDYGKFDCFSLVRLTKFALQGIHLPDFERPEDLQTCNSVFLQEAKSLGFVQVPLERRQPWRRCDHAPWDEQLQCTLLFWWTMTGFCTVGFFECDRAVRAILCEQHCSRIPLCSRSGLLGDLGERYGTEHTYGASCPAGRICELQHVSCAQKRISRGSPARCRMRVRSSLVTDLSREDLPLPLGKNDAAIYPGIAG